MIKLYSDGAMSKCLSKLKKGNESQSPTVCCINYVLLCTLYLWLVFFLNWSYFYWFQVILLLSVILKEHSTQIDCNLSLNQYSLLLDQVCLLTIIIELIIIILIHWQVLLQCWVYFMICWAVPLLEVIKLPPSIISFLLIRQRKTFSGGRSLMHWQKITKSKYLLLLVVVWLQLLSCYSFTVTHILSSPDKSWTGSCGRVTQEFLQSHLPPPPTPASSKQHLICICGPQPFTTGITTALMEMDYPESCIHVFDWWALGLFLLLINAHIYCTTIIHCILVSFVSGKTLFIIMFCNYYFYVYV